MALLNRLNHNNEWLTDILESSCEGIVVEEHDRIVYANDAFASLHGYDGPAELIGRHTSCFQARTEHGRVGAYGGMRLKGEPAPAAYEFKGVRKDGSEVELEASVSTFTSGGRSFIITTLRDITERKQAETRLEESEQRYRSLFEHHPDAVYSLDLAGRLQSANPTCYALTGYTDALLGQPFLPLLVPEHVEKGLRHFRRAISGEPQKFEVAITSQGGRRIELSITNLPIFIDGKIAGVYGIAQDITERLRARAALAERENLLQAMFDAGPECVKLIARDGTLLNMNRSGLAMIEVESLEQAVGKNVYQLVTAECRQSFIELNEAIFRGESKELRFEIVGKRGTRRYVESHAVPLRDQQGEIVAHLAVTRDITERRRAEEALRESEERYRELVENAKDIIYTHDLNGRYTSLNRAGEEITGYTRAEALTMSFEDTVPPDRLERIRQMFAAKLGGREETVYECEMLAKNGSRLQLEVNSRLIYKDGAPAGVLGVARDVTERKGLEEQLRQAQKMEAVGRLAGGVAHDFNNLLTAITGYSDLSLRRLADNPAVRRNLEEVKKAAERAAGLTRQLLAFSRKQVLQPKVIVLNDVIHDMNKMLQRLIGEDVELRAELDPRLGRVKADPGQIEQVIMNLSVNARDAMPLGGRLTIATANATLTAEDARRHHYVQPGAYVLLSITDTGCGMDEETRKHIFEPFFTTKEVGKGTGLGLSTVYGIVKQSGGYVWADSEIGRGTTFRIYFPRVEAPIRSDIVKDGDGALPQGEETVLLVEDEDIVRELTHEFLEMSGYTVLEARNGRDAITICEQHDGPINLVLTDVVMPQMSGRELVERLAPLRPAMRVLYMSGYTDDQIVHHGVLSESKSFLEKPFTIQALARKVRAVLDAV